VIALYVALLKRAMKRAIAHSLFFKKRMTKQLLNRSFAKRDEKSDCSFALFKEQMSKRSLYCSFEKSGNER